MITAQVIVFATIIIGFIFFVWNKFRYDVVSLIILVILIISGFFIPNIISPEKAFLGFGHEVIIIVASMFVLSKALISSGFIDLITRRLFFLRGHPIVQLFFLVVLVAIISAFINNIGAVALIMPVAMQMAKRNNVSPAMFLLPIAFASHLGGFLTLIGTPRNIIISSFREDAGFEQFGMFDFSFVGGGVALVGIIFIVILGVLFFKNKPVPKDSKELFEIEDYVMEAKVAEKSKFIGKYLKDLSNISKIPFAITAMIRNGKKIKHLSGYEIIQEGDILLIESESDTLTDIIETAGLNLSGQISEEKDITVDEEQGVIEAVIPPDSYLVGKSWRNVSINMRFGVNLLAISRFGEKIKERIDRIFLKPSDVLIFQGRKESVNETLSSLGIYPLADREMTLGRKTKIFTSFIIFISAITLATLNIMPISIIFLTAALFTILFGVISIKQAYDGISFPVLILLGGMLTLGFTLENSGGAETLAFLLLNISDVMSPVFLLIAVLIFAMILSDFVNTTAAVVIVAPIAIVIAQSLGASIDPFLMAVAIGGSSAFLTPTGHESNTLVIDQGKYKYSDYLKFGLPLEIIIIFVSVPLILYFWPLF